jgi:hypothetical protein
MSFKEEMEPTSIIASTYVSCKDPSECFGFTIGHHFLRLNQNGSIVVFSIPQEVDGKFQ